MKKTLLIGALFAIAVAITTLSPFMGFAEETDLWSYESFTYTNGTEDESDDIDGLEVTGYFGSETDIYIPANFEVDGEKLPVLKLADGLFRDYDGKSNINSVTLSSDIRIIGEEAFSGCENLVCILTSEKLVSIGANAFSDCRSFNSVILREALTEICENAFSDVKETVTVYVAENSYAHTYCEENEIPYVIISESNEIETVTLDGIEYYLQNGEAYAISFDNSISDVVIPAAVEGYPVVDINDVFKGTEIESIDLPDGITVIDKSAFHGCTNLESISFPKYVTEFGKYTFSGCKKLGTVQLPDGITEIPEDMFFNSSFEHVIIPEGVANIRDYAFYQCTDYGKITIPTTVIKTGTGSFDNSSLDIYISDLDAWCNIDFSGSVFNGGYSNLYLNGERVTTLKIPDGINEIKSNAFSGCGSITDVVIPNTVAKIGDSSFRGCGNLERVTIPESVMTIGEFAFYSCGKMNNIIIPQSVNEMYSKSFYNGTILCVYENSYAETFAKENNLSYLVTNGESVEFITIDGVTYACFLGKAIAIEFDNSVTEIVIPEKVNDYNVIGIAKAFSYSKIKSIELPDGLTKVTNGAFYGCSELTSVSLPDTITEVEDSAFRNCTSLTKIEINNGVTKIGDYAFFGCTRLFDIQLPETLLSIGTSAFSRCKSITEMIIPENVTSLGGLAFQECSSLREVSVPGSIEIIKGNIFPDCPKLELVVFSEGISDISISFDSGNTPLRIVLPESAKNISLSSDITTILCVCKNSYAHTYAIENDWYYYIADDGQEPEFYTVDGIEYFIFENKAVAISYDGSVTDVKIPESVEGYTVTDINTALKKSTAVTKIDISAPIVSLDAEAFYSCVNLTDIKLPDSLTIIGEKAFYNCGNLNNINLPENITSIASETFMYSGISDIVMPSGIKEIGSRAFSHCNKLTKITIPESVTTIGGAAFSFCNLKEVILPSSLEYMGGYIFQDTPISLVTFSDGIKTIGASAFGGSGITSVEIPNTVTKIEYNAFYSCKNLKNITIPEGVETIESRAFDNCTSLRTVTIPKSVTLIESGAFPETTILCVYKDSYAHQYAVENDMLYFILRETVNPEIAYGKGITGSVKYEDGSIADGVTVEIVYNDGTVKESVTTDDSGSYSFTYAEVGEYIVRAIDSSGNLDSENVSVKRMNVFDVYVAGKTDLELKASYAVSGTVTGSGDITVTISDLYGNVINSVTAEEGAFSFNNVSNGTYIVKAENEEGSCAAEITVFNAGVTGISLIIATSEESATISGSVTDSEGIAKAWVSVTAYDSEGNAVASVKTDSEGSYVLKGLPLDDYAIVAEGSDMRTDKKHGYKRSVVIKGFAFVEATEAGAYTADIVLYDETEDNAAIEGKVTANGEHQRCEVYLTDVFRHEIAKLLTGANGKYKFVNVKDGLYFVTAITESDGMGMTVVVVRGGRVYGETDITVYKGEKIKNREQYMKDNIPECMDRNEAVKYKDKIMEEKHFYDGLSAKEKKQLSKEYIDRLNKLVELITQTEYSFTGDVTDITVSNAGSVVEAEEVYDEDIIEIEICIEKINKTELTSSGITTDEEYIQQSIEDASGDRGHGQYYNISMKKGKNGGNKKEIANIHKDTNTTGRMRITMQIPEEYKGYKHYHFVHVHNGETVTLADLDDNPDTITFEVDRFSTFALTYSNEELSEDVSGEVSPEPDTPATPTYKSTITATTGGYVKQGDSPISGTIDSASGETVTLTAVADEGSEFLGWINASTMKVITTNPTYTYSAYANRNITALFADNSMENEVFVSFLNKNNQYMFYSYIPKGSDTTSYAPSADKMYATGYTFTGWNPNTGVVEENTDYEGKYSKDADKFVVTVVNGTDANGRNEFAETYNTRITVTPDAAPEGGVFAGWKIGDALVSYDEKFTFYVFGDTTIEAIYSENAEETPLVTMISTEKSLSGEITVATFLALKYLPQNYTYVDSGMIYVKTEADENVLILENEGQKINEKEIKRTTTAAGTNMFRLSASYKEEGITARAYLIYLDEKGERKVIYTPATFITNATENGGGIDEDLDMER